jgi:hypothetical protein
MGMHKLAPATTALLAMMAGGCTTVGNLTSIYRTPDLDSGRSVVLDAEQWAVLNREQGDGRSICTMPSPDALAAAAASGSLSIDNPSGASGGGAFALGESAASIGLRTQSIQLLRDAMFRMCEAHANGSIDGYELGIMMRRFQSSMVAILAIEQLTGAVVAPPAAVSATGEATVLEALMRERRVIDRRITEIDQLVSDNGYQGDKESLTKEKERLEAEREEYTDAIGAVTRGDFAAAELMVGAVSNRQNGLSGSNVAAVASAVESITLAAMGTQDNFHEEMCFEMARSREGREELADSDFRDYCVQLAAANINERNMFLSSVNQTLQVFLSDGRLTPDEMRMLDQMLAQIDRHWTRGDLRSLTPVVVSEPPQN